MTITEQLQFSVLAAPVATLDRRALSQAWYSALYGSANVSQGAPARISAAPSESASIRGTQGAVANARTRQPAQSAGSAPSPRTLANFEETPLERRAPRSALARKIERAFLPGRSGAQKAWFSVEAAHGRVHLLLQSRGTRLKLIAICPPKARAHVAAALAQARYALAARGVDLDAEARERAQC